MPRNHIRVYHPLYSDDTFVFELGTLSKGYYQHIDVLLNQNITVASMMVSPGGKSVQPKNI
jgi:hypothetical protein